MKSKPYQRAAAALQLRTVHKSLKEFGNHAYIVCEDGSVFNVRNAVIEVWTDPEDKQKWVLLFCEHYLDQVFNTNDLLAWGQF